MAIRPITTREYQDPALGANCFGCSPRNTKGLQLTFRPDGDEVLTEINLSSDYESYPGMIHGGIVALILDEVMGRAAVWRAQGLVLTMGIKVRYAAVVKPDTQYTCRAGAEFVAARRLKGTATIEDGSGVLVASGSATFVCLESATDSQMTGARITSLLNDISDG